MVGKTTTNHIGKKKNNHKIELWEKTTTNKNCGKKQPQIRIVGRNNHKLELCEETTTN